MTDNRKSLADVAGAAARPSPFIKWAGGKSQLLPVLQQHLPERIHRYYEPFVGGGAMFFHLFRTRPQLKATLSDLNDELITCYTAVRDKVEDVIKELKKHRNDREYFYALRSLDSTSLGTAQRAARLIFLNKTCFNGLYRVNSRGQFNVPFGDYKNPRTCDEFNLRAVSNALQSVRLSSAQFQDALKLAHSGDFIYLDPPYQPLSATANFTSYTSRCFGEDDQRKLAQLVAQLDRRGCFIMLSNSDNALIHQLYTSLRIQKVYATRAINCKGEQRGPISELLITNY